MTISIREALPTDWQTIKDFNAALAIESENKQLDDELLTQGVQRALSEKNHVTYILAQSDERVVGQLMVTREWSDWRNGWFWWIQSVYVEPDYRGRGIFKELYGHIKNQAENSLDVVGLRLYVHTSNESAKKTYGHLGLHHTDYQIMELSF